MHSYADLYRRLPQYKCHKIVAAMKITAIADYGFTATLGDEQHKVKLFADWFSKHEPKVGGYLVVYEDGYLSYSPAGAFESGYTLIEEPGKTTFRERLDREHAELWGRHQKLVNFLASDAVQELTKDALDLLEEQSRVMDQYIDILVQRRALYGVSEIDSDTLS